MMTSYERLMARLAGKPVDRAPNLNLIMSFAPTFVGAKLRDFYWDYRVLCHANMRVQSFFGLDMLTTISEPYREAADFGLPLEWPEDSLAITLRPLVAEPDDLAELVIPDPRGGGRMTDRLNAIALFRHEAGGRIPILGWVEGAMAEACILRGVQPAMLDAFDRPQWLHDLLGICQLCVLAFGKAQIEEGADVIGIGDSIASQFGPGLYREFILPYEREQIAAIHAQGALARLHICGDISSIIEDVAQTGADIVDIDWMVPFQRAAQVLGPRTVVSGNFDPVAVLLQGTPGQVQAEVFRCLREGGRKACIAAGCEVPRYTPYINLRAEAEALQAWGWRDY